MNVSDFEVRMYVCVIDYVLVLAQGSRETMAGVGGMWFFGIAAAFYEMPVRMVPQGAQAPAVPVALSTTPRLVAPPLDQGSRISKFL